MKAELSDVNIYPNPGLVLTPQSNNKKRKLRDIFRRKIKSFNIKIRKGL